MPIFEIAGFALDLPRNVALVDTNVLVALADERDQHHEQTMTFLQAEDDYQLLVLPPVVVEACAMLIRRNGHSQKALWLITWLLTPGNALVLPAPHSPNSVSSALFGHGDWMRRFGVDYVDAYIMEAADRLSRGCTLRPAVPIITFDTGDYYKCSLNGLEFSLYDMKDLQLVVFNI